MDFPETPHRTFTNLRRADWTSFTRVTEEGFSGLAPPSSCSTGEGEFRRILSNASKHHIPRGHIHNMIPDLSQTAKLLIRQRDFYRSHLPTSPNIRMLDEQITQEIYNSNRQTWINAVE